VVAVLETAKNIDGEWLTEEKLFERHGKLVHHVLQRLLGYMRIRQIEYEDACSVGMIGLLKAYRNFDNQYGIRFSTYAVPMISWEVRKYIIDSNAGAKFPRGVKELSNQINIRGIDHKSIPEIAKEMNVPQEKVAEAINYMKNEKPLSFYDFVFGEEITVEETISNETDFTTVFVQEFLNSLTPMERTAVLMTEEGYTQTEIGNVLGISQVQVSRILKRIGQKYIAFERGEIHWEGNAKRKIKTRSAEEDHHQNWRPDRVAL
jgi:RNA polymerase sigma factor (sigma-70 family)